MDLLKYHITWLAAGGLLFLSQSSNGLFAEKKAKPVKASSLSSDGLDSDSIIKEKISQVNTYLDKGKAYLAEYAKQEGVKGTGSGLLYKVIKPGTGAIPKSTDTISAHYHGTLIDGTTFDSSYDRGEPASFPVTGVIKGWVEALQLMNVGSTWELVIPSELAYGANPRPGGPIGPHAVLKFKIELISIN